MGHYRISKYLFLVSRYNYKTIDYMYSWNGYISRISSKPFLSDKEHYMLVIKYGELGVVQKVET